MQFAMNKQSFLFYFLVECNDNRNMTCKVANETCDMGKCKCGNMSQSCEGQRSGSYCDAANDKCKCTKDLDSCKEDKGGDFCDVASNSCKCGPDEPYCSDIKAPYCNKTLEDDGNKCTCSPTVDACNGEDIDSCFEGACSCGNKGSPCEADKKCIKGKCGNTF